MREPYGSIAQGTASALVFGAFAVVAGVLVGWPTSDILSVGLIAGCGGAAVEHVMRRHYGVAGVFILAALGITAYSLRPQLNVGAAIRDAAADERQTGTSFPGSGSSASSGGERKREDRQRRRQEGGGLTIGGERSPADTIPTTVQIHNPSQVPVQVVYEYPGGSLALGSVDGGGSTTFTIPLRGPLELGTIIGRAGDRTVRTYIWLRPRRAHQVELPSID